jgi:multiple sugar transport system substrate-binding protein
LTFGSNHSDAAPKGAMQQVVDAFMAATGIAVNVNTIDHKTFQEQISTYLQGRPDDVFTWFAGYRMRFFANKALTGDVSDVWASLAANYSDAFRAASTADDGRQYFVPFYNYPWVLMYRRSLFNAKGYEAPATYDELLALCERMRLDGLVPIAFGDKDGWPAMGYFDILNMRLNGYAFHTGLMDGRESWTDQRVREVFVQWRRLLPYLQPAALGRSWQEAAQAMVNESAGMFFAGTFAGEQATGEQRADLELLEFPALGTRYDAEKAIDAPINGFMMSRTPANPDAAKAFLRFLGSGPAQDVFISANPNYVAAANDASRDGYTQYQRRMAEIIGGAGRIAQFMDRDTRPDFAGPTGMQSFLQDFLSDPSQDLDALLGRVQQLWDSLS